MRACTTDARSRLVPNLHRVQQVFSVNGHTVHQSLGHFVRLLDLNPAQRNFVMCMPTEKAARDSMCKSEQISGILGSQANGYDEL